jgi:hypothetical protein
LANLGVAEHCHKVAFLGREAVHPKAQCRIMPREADAVKVLANKVHEFPRVLFDNRVMNVRLRKVTVGKFAQASWVSS